MKRKQTNATPKATKVVKAAKKAKPVKVVEKEVEENEEEEVPQIKVNTKTANKKITKSKKVIEKVPEPEPEPEDDDDDEVDEDEQDEDDKVNEDNEESEENEDEAEEAENNDENDEEDEEDGPSEEDIGTEEPTIPTEVKSGPIDPTVPLAKIIHISKLPKKCKQINIVEAFAKYGPIEQINIVTTPVATTANVLYKTEKAALAAIADSNKVKVLDTTVSVFRKKESNKTKNMMSRDRCIHIKNFKPNTTEEQLREHFQSCGEIESVKVIKIHSPYAYVTFTDKSAMPAALKLHNSILNGVNIKVNQRMCVTTYVAHTYDENLTIILKNKQGLESLDVAKLEAIFAKCGEIVYVDVVCKKHILALISFKTEEAAQKSLKLNGKTVQEIELEIEPYKPLKKWTTVHVTNLSKEITEEDLRQHFSKAGTIENIIHVQKQNYAIIRFTDSDGYCKAFLYNESFIKGQIIFIEPHSMRKQSILKKKIAFKKGGFKKGFKRPHANGHSVFNAKKPKTH